MRAIDAFIKIVCMALAWAAGACLVCMMLLACANMTMRVFHLPIAGTFELMGFLGAVAAAFSLGYTQLAKGHIAVNLFAGRWPRQVDRAIDSIASLVSAVFFLIAARETAKWSGFLVETGELSETLRIIYYPFTYMVALGCFVLALALGADFLRSVLPKGGRA